VVTAKIKNSDINQESEKANAVRIAVPVDQTIPDYPLNLALYAFFEQAMFVFDNVLDKDVTSYEYELYKSDQVTGSFPNYSLINNPTIYLSGESSSNVFAVAVENSTDTTTIRYYGRVRTKDTSNNYSSWSPLVLSDQDTPLIGNQYVASLTAAKITAGTIGAHQIVLSQAGAQTNIAAPANMAILRSSDYNGSYDNGTSSWTNGTSGWVVAGDGHAEFSSASIRGGLKAGSVYINADNRWRRNSSDTSSSSEFKVGSSDKYLYFDGTDLTFTGNLSAAGGTFTGALSGGTIDIGGSDATSFHVDIEGNMWLGAGVFADGTFRVTKEGDAYANSLTTKSVKFEGNTEIGNNGKIFMGAGNFNNDDTPFYVDSDSQFSLGTKLVWNGNALTVRGNLKLEDGSLAVNSNGATAAANTLIKSNGFVGGLTLTDEKLFFGQGTFANTNTAFYVGKNNSTGQADFSLGNKLTWNGNVLTVQGTLRLADGTDAVNSNGAAQAANTLIRSNGFVGGLTLGNEKLFFGQGLYNNQNTAFYVGKNNSTGQADFSLGDKLTWNGENLAIKGNITATSGTFAGNLSAAGGTFTGTLSVGSVRVGNEAINSGSPEKGISISGAGLSQWNNAWIQRSDNSIYFRAGNTTRYIQLDTSGNNEIKFPNFSVNNEGSIVATNADITGRITATSGTISGDLVTGGTIKGTSIDIGNGTFQVTSSGEMTATAGKLGPYSITSQGISQEEGIRSVKIHPVVGTVSEPVLTVAFGDFMSKVSAGSFYIENGGQNSALSASGVSTLGTVSASGFISTYSKFLGKEIDTQGLSTRFTVNSQTGILYTASNLGADAFGLAFGWKNSNGKLLFIVNNDNNVRRFH
jgi:hypothetical protein